MGGLGASCFHTLTDETRDIEKQEWDNERFGMVCTNAENFADMKKAILKFCSKYKICSFEFKKKVNEIASKAEALTK